MKTVLTTTEILERKRAQYWQDAVCDTFVELDCEVRAKRPFFGELATTQCDGLHFSNVRSEGQIVKRTRTRIRRAREEVMLISLQVSGVGLVAQDGREARTRARRFCLLRQHAALYAALQRRVRAACPAYAARRDSQADRPH